MNRVGIYLRVKTAENQPREFEAVVERSGDRGRFRSDEARRATALQNQRYEGLA